MKEYSVIDTYTSESLIETRNVKEIENWCFDKNNLILNEREFKKCVQLMTQFKRGVIESFVVKGFQIHSETI